MQLGGEGEGGPKLRVPEEHRARQEEEGEEEEEEE